MRFVLSLFVLLSFALDARARTCWEEAGSRYGVSPYLLHAIARVESDLNQRAVNASHRAISGTYDIGLMQINSSNLSALERHGIKEKDLYAPCTNIAVGAWILSQNFSRYGVTWDAVGAYNAACTKLKGNACRQARAKYAWSVYRRLYQEPPLAHESLAVRSQIADVQPAGFHVRVKP
jgi:soluble lytic murein transglycosylase-like protein